MRANNYLDIDIINEDGSLFVQIMTFIQIDHDDGTKMLSMD